VNDFTYLLVLCRVIHKLLAVLLHHFP
jgi:hypothetical protein